MTYDILRAAKCLAAGFGVSVWRKRGLNTTRYYMRENGYVSSIDEAHARDLCLMLPQPAIAATIGAQS